MRMIGAVVGLTALLACGPENKNLEVYAVPSFEASSSREVWNYVLGYEDQQHQRHLETQLVPTTFREMVSQVQRSYDHGDFNRLVLHAQDLTSEQGRALVSSLGIGDITVLSDWQTTLNERKRYVISPLAKFYYDPPVTSVPPS